jgi:tRNA modification GTPase
MQNYYTDTVAAVSTPYGKGGVALIRISGPRALSVAETVFLPKNKKSVKDLPSAAAVYGDILKEGAPIDDGLLTVFRAPRSFTGEDTAEICCHGGILLQQRVLEAVFEAGARPAGPGEFSKRAFLNGKLSLTGAEAVIDLINAENDLQLSLAKENGRGRLSRACEDIYGDLAALLASVYVFTDYPDEDLTDLSSEEFTEGLLKIKERVERLVSSYKTGRAVMEGIPTAIVGKPNTGKSSLLNLLLGKERAIVSPLAGTTRDTIEETALLAGVTLRLCDTAGIRESDDHVESIGIDRSFEKLKEAELVFALFDLSRPLDGEDRILLSALEQKNSPVIALLNKKDLPRMLEEPLPERFIKIEFSAKEGLPASLEETVASLFETDRLRYDRGAILTCARQAAAARAALSSLESAIEALRLGVSRDVAALDAELAMGQIAEIDGRAVGEDIVSAIFSRFCVGK